MKSLIQNRPIYLFLLSLFFVFHGYTENFDFIPLKDIALLLLIYILSSLALTGIIWLIFRNESKAAFIAFLLMGFYFFFGAIYDRIMDIAPRSFFSKYTVILSAFFIFFLLCLILLFRYKHCLKLLNYVLNVFFISLLLVDCVWLISKIISPKSFSDTSFKKNFAVCDACSKPDIYLIVADEYGGDQALRETMNFDNSAFRQELEKRGFFSPASLSNYNFTPFSIASMLEMEYLQGLEGSNSSHSDLSQCYNVIRNNRVFQFLNSHGYQLYNYSIFDIHDQPSLVKESALPARTRFITAQTLFNRLDNNILFNMAEKFGKGAKKRRLMLSYNSNVKALASLEKCIPQTLPAPKFVYTHLIMPHYPYYFTREGVFREYEDMRYIQEKNLAHYIEYLQYTNNILLKLFDTIIAKSAKPPVIILVSDHGFREYPGAVDKKYRFMNHLSVYLPDRNYTSFYNGISNVNLFRVFFNTQFHQHFPLLKDSTSFLRP